MSRRNPDPAERARMLGTDPILPLLAKIAVPATVAMGVTSLYGVVDAVFIGRGVDALAIGGLSVAFPIQMIVLAVGLMVGVGAASIVSRGLGAGDRERAARAVGTGFITVIALSALLVLGGLLAADRLLILFGATPDLFAYAKTYLVAVIPGAPFIACAVAAGHLARSEGRATYSMAIVVVGALLNIGLDPLFIFGLDMGIRGAAVATVVSQFCSFLLALWFFLKPVSSLGLRWSHLKPNLHILGEEISLGGAALIRQLGTSFFVIITNNALRSYGGALEIAAFGIVLRVLIFCLTPLIGIAYGFQPIVGYNYGAKNFDRVREAVRKTSFVEFAISLVPFAVVVLFPETVLRVFTSDADLIDIGRRAIRIVLLGIPLVGLQVVGAVYFQAVGRAIPALILSISRQILFLIPLMLLLPFLIGLSGVWAAFPIADSAATVVTVVWLAASMRNLKRSDPSTVV